MELQYLLICVVCFLGSGLTLFSGFGLGTLMVPVFGLFFPIEIAISLTAIVHFLNNLFKLFLLGTKANKGMVLKFGIPSLLASFIGAMVLGSLTGMEPVAVYEWNASTFYISPVKLTIAGLLAFFSLVELIPSWSKLQFEPRYLIPGGFISGFFGGLSGNQGALRTAFLIKSGLDKEAFIATGVVIACMVDVARLLVYSDRFVEAEMSRHGLLLLIATASAFAGAFIGNRLLKKMTIQSVQKIVAITLLLFSLLLGAGII